MFKNLIAVPQRDAFWALKKKVDEHVFRPPEPLSAHATLMAVCRHVEQVEDLLEEREALLNREGGMYRERTIDWLERRIDESVGLQGCWWLVKCPIASAASWPAF